MCKTALKTNIKNIKYIAKYKPIRFIKPYFKHPHTLSYVKYQTDEICMMAVRTNGLALRHVVIQTKDIIVAAVKQNARAVKYIDYPSIELYKELVRVNGLIIGFIEFNKFIKFNKRDIEYMHIEAVKQNINALRYKEAKCCHEPYCCKQEWSIPQIY